MSNRPDKIHPIALELAKILPDEWKEAEETFNCIVPIIQASDSADALNAEHIHICLNKRQFQCIKGVVK